mmetsp:Transcript_14706/g.47979  ORF Transcript_14706/g.47979 Transcript_14706/m.47979 type:complete len:212 (-) Transcript_14706:183-818(-)
MSSVNSSTGSKPEIPRSTNRRRQTSGTWASGIVRSMMRKCVMPRVYLSPPVAAHRTLRCRRNVTRYGRWPARIPTRMLRATAIKSPISRRRRSAEHLANGPVSSHSSKARYEEWSASMSPRHLSIAKRWKPARIDSTSPIVSRSFPQRKRKFTRPGVERYSWTNTVRHPETFISDCIADCMQCHVPISTYVPSMAFAYVASSSETLFRMAC